MKQNAASTNNMPCELVTWGQFNELSRTLAHSIRSTGYNIDLLVAIGRGGYMPGRIVSDILGVMNLTTFKIEHYHGSRKSDEAFIRYPLVTEVEEQNILLVDDVSDSGDTFKIAMEHIKTLGTPKHIKTAVLHHKAVSSFVPDHYAALVKQWRWIIYPWAVTEDLAVLIDAIEPAMVDIEDIQNRLLENHGIKPTVEQIRDALTLIH